MKPSVVNWLSAIARNHCSYGKHNLVAAVVHKSTPISIGYNSYKKSHPVQLQVSGHPEKIYLHAEVDALIKAQKLVEPEVLSKCDLYVIRIKKDGTYGTSKPCDNCQRYIQGKVKNVHYF